ncbi:MAG: hypothetical protein QM811_14725 [Pirellulales bacterium]
MSYLIDGKSQSLKPGQSYVDQKLKSGVVVEFMRDGKEKARYTLTAGDYDFRQTDKGWELYRAAEKK